jgi:PAS domain-containing protein
MDRATIAVLVSTEYRADVREALTPRYEVTTDSYPETADLCLTDPGRISIHRAALTRLVCDQQPRFYPVVYLCRRADDVEPVLDHGGTENPPLIDDVVRAPVDLPVLYRRLDNLVMRRRHSITVDRYRQRTSQRFEGLFDVLAEPAFLLDPDTVVQQVNDAFCEFLGKGRECLLGYPLSEVLRLNTREGHRTGTHIYPDTVAFDDGSGQPRYAKLSVRSKHLDGEVMTVGLLTELTDMTAHPGGPSSPD